MLSYLRGLRRGLLGSTGGFDGVHAHEHAQDPVFTGVLEFPTGTRGCLLTRIEPPKALSWSRPLRSPVYLEEEKAPTCCEPVAQSM